MGDPIQHPAAPGQHLSCANFCIKSGEICSCFSLAELCVFYVG